MLLIDEIDRADDDFEAFLLELLGEAAVTIPELGTIRATHPPAIVNAVIDALYETHGVEHIDMPCNPARVWAAMQGRPEPPQ